MSIKFLDVLVFIPVIPAIPVVATWFLPWERWIPRKIPNKIIGPYLVYCSFACWYFRVSWWVILPVATLGVGACVIAGFDPRKAQRLKQSRNWPATEGYVTGISETQDSDGYVNVTLAFNYKVSDERYGGTEVLVFKSEQEASRFKRESGVKLKVHYQPDKPEVYVLGHESIP